MRLKKVVLQGFKSFANKTEIEILDGITVVVGPNGSGKSNISDALRWVLGEQSAKLLRCSKMEDVIFSGTASRKKLGFAEVSIYIDNSDGELASEYNEVVITKQAFRQGDTKYLINNQECRLKDVLELFYDTGLGKDGYSVIGQGKIDEILSTKSEERRAIFEEASGIMKYKVKKEEATRKLLSTETNLTRVSDILNEIEASLATLEEKSVNAKKFLDLKERLKEIDINIFLSRMEENANYLTNLDDKIETLNSDILNEENTAVEIEKAKMNLKDRFKEVLENIEKVQNRYYEMENNLEKINSKISLLNNNIENNNETVNRFKNEIIEEEEKIKILEEEINLKEEKKASLSENKLKFENELEEKQKELDKLNLSLDEKGKIIEEYKLSVEEKTDKINEIEINISALNSTILSNKKQIENINIDKNNIEKDKLNKDKNLLEEELNNKNNELINIQNEIKKTEEIYNNEKSKIDDKINLQNKIKSELLEKSSKLNYLINLQKENDGYFKSVKSILENNKSATTMANIISVDSKYEKAIEIALGGFIQNVITKDESEAKEYIRYLKENNLGRATFLPLTTVKKVNKTENRYSKFEGVIDSAYNLVSYDEKYEDVIRLALSNVIIVNNLDNANNMFKKVKDMRLVTLEGEIITQTGSMTGGSMRATSLLGREDKINKLKEKVVEAQNKLNDIENELTVKTKDLNKYVETSSRLLEEKQKLLIDINTLEEKKTYILKEIERNINIQSKVSENKEILENEILENENKIKEYNIETEKYNEYILDKQKSIDEYTRFNKEESTKMDYINEDIINLKISLTSFEETNLSINEMKDKLNADISNFNISMEKKKNDIKTYENQNIAILQEIENSKNEIVQLGKFKEEYKDITEKLKNDKEEYIKKQDLLEIKMLESVAKVNKLKEEVSKTENKKTKYEIEIENLRNKMWDEYEITLSSAREYMTNREKLENINKMDKEANKLREDIKLLGYVDVSSIEEFVNTKNRFEFLNNQKIDLETSKEKLEKLISNMQSIMKKQFIENFNIINKNFAKSFEKLFGGGKARVYLTDESNVLESGIEIEVEPPGKKLKHIMQLSGGEKALTGAALLFAILKIKAPPFCVLDEIEAALDDVNVNRFAEYIKEYSKDTQFLVITHRKGTMVIADAVYGVTMEEYGVSKILSMKMK